MNACSTPPVATESEQTVEVVARIGDLSKSPEWSGQPGRFRREGTRLVYIHAVSMGADATVIQCLTTVQDAGRARMMTALHESFRSAEPVVARVAARDAGVEALLASLAKGELVESDIRETYWEKRVEPRPGHVQALVLYCAGKVSVDEESLVRQLSSLSAAAGKGEDETIRSVVVETVDGLVRRRKR